MYAIVDIETTGSHAHENGITEIAIVLHNGKEVEGRYETLVNPGVPIPKYVASLTGISNQMVSVAPSFSEVAPHIFNLLQNRIFIAHNVNFDYSFIKYHLRVNGIEWTAKKICTLRLSRKAFPGLIKYGLENICRELDIQIENRHRAGGDAYATTVLFEKILHKGGEQMVREFMKKDGREQILPPNLPEEQVRLIPYVPGVYYFHDAKGKVIYVGKAKILKKRVISHFTGLDIGKRRQEFLKNIHSITYQECPTEFTASLLESVEIKRLWPMYNYSQKKFNQLYAIYFFEDSAGYFRLAIDKKKRNLHPLASFNMLSDAYRMLWKMVKTFSLNTTLCFLDISGNDIGAEDPEKYNEKVKESIEWLQTQKETFLIKEEQQQPASYVLVEEGRFYGMGSCSADVHQLKLEDLKLQLTPYPENEVIRSMITSFIEKYPHKVERLG